MEFQRFAYLHRSVWKAGGKEESQINIYRIGDCGVRNRHIDLGTYFDSNEEVARHLIGVLEQMSRSPVSLGEQDGCRIYVASAIDPNNGITDEDGRLNRPYLSASLKECELVGSDSNLRELQSELVKILSSKK